jgi:sigma-B regulation protein RsbQ
MNVEILKRNNVTVQGNLNSEQTIIFAHGFGTDQTAWDKVKTAFANNYKIILYDNIGAGKSDIEAYDPAKYQSLEAYAQDLVDIVEALQLKDAIFVGHSVSSMVGSLASLVMPGAFSKMILIGASPRYLNDNGYQGGFTQATLDDLYTAMQSNYYEWAGGFSKLAMGNEHNPALANNFAQSLLSLRPDIALAVARSIFQSDFRHILAFIKRDVLLIQSASDVAVPNEVALYLKQNITGSTLITVDSDGHFPHISAPQAIINAIDNFVKAEAVCLT